MNAIELRDLVLCAVVVSAMCGWVNTKVGHWAAKLVSFACMWMALVLSMWTLVLMGQEVLR